MRYRHKPAAVGALMRLAGASAAGAVVRRSAGRALALVITGARTDRIDVPYIIFGLRMGFRVAIDLARRRLQHARRFTAREIEYVECADDACLQGPNGIALVMPR